MAFMFAGAGLLSGCQSGFFGPGGSFGTETTGGDKISCIENLDKCSKRCEVETANGAKFFRDYPLDPAQCKKPEPPTPETT